MKKIIAILSVIALLLGIGSTTVFAAGGIELPDVPVNKENAGIELPDIPVIPGPKPSDLFTDVSSGDWFCNAVDYAVKKGLFYGVSETEFSPLTNMTRAQFVQVLANIEQPDFSKNNVSFTDVKAGAWYKEEVEWAATNNIVAGIGDGTFQPEKAVTREQMCLMLVNYINYKKFAFEKAENKELFDDDNKISDWAESAVYACQMAGIINGDGKGSFNPQDVAQRAQVATMMSIFHNLYKNKL